MGKPISQSRAEVTEAVHACERLLELVPAAVQPQNVEDSATARKWIHHQPRGVVFILSSWDFPLSGCLPQCVMAVLSGNTVILKHSPLSPLSGHRISQAFGHTPELVQNCQISIMNFGELVKSTFIDFIHFTGATESAQSVSTTLASTKFIDTAYCLTTTNTAYVAHDADLQLAAKCVVDNVMKNSGQHYEKFSTVLVDKAVIKEFLEAVEPLVRSYCLGDPMDPLTSIGPLAQPELPLELQEFIKSASQGGASVVCGGAMTHDNQGKGRFFEPTLLTDVHESSNVSLIQPLGNYGPVLVVNEVENSDEAVETIKNLEFCYTQAVFTRSHEVVDMFRREVNSGVLLANEGEMKDIAMPRGLVKGSGNAPKYGLQNILEFTYPKSIIQKL